MQVFRRTIEASSLAFSSMATTVKPVQKQRAEAMYHKPLGAQRGRGETIRMHQVARMQATITITRMNDSMERGGGGGGGQGLYKRRGYALINRDRNRIGVLLV